MNKILEMAAKRMAICNECPAFNSTARTCGTPLNKLNPLGETMTLDGVTFKPCGCFLDVKTKMTLSDCPAGKWEKVVDGSLIQDAQTLLFNARKNGALNNDERITLARLKSLMTGRSEKVTSCVTCVNQTIAELNKQLKREEVLQIEEQPQTSKKRGRKPRKPKL
jgi:hypothetical protein